jgi:hypothetical protein
MNGRCHLVRGDHKDGKQNAKDGEIGTHVASSTAFGYRAIFHRIVRDRGIFVYRPIVALDANEEPGAPSVSRDSPQSGCFAPNPQCQAAVTRLAAL